MKLRGMNRMDKVVVQIVEIVQKYNIEKAVLFGSRARGDHSMASDYDIAVYEEALSDYDRAAIFDEIENIQTLKKIQVVYVRESGTDELLENINREGVIIYEQIRN
jgi:predicted nucleotidyltransferase